MQSISPLRQQQKSVLRGMYRLQDRTHVIRRSVQHITKDPLLRCKSDYYERTLRKGRMNAPKGFSKRTRQVAEGHPNGLNHLLMDDLYYCSYWWGRAGTYDDFGHKMLWLLLMAELADDNQNAPD